MLVFISDLHFVDGTAGEHNIPTQAVNYFFNHLEAIANKDSQKGRIEELNIVFLGDVFDLLRTEYWLDREEDETPWGNNEEAIETHALTIFDSIVTHQHEDMDNPQTFELLRKRIRDLKSICNLTKDPELIYIPGNHDRLCNKYSSLRQKVCQTLGLNHNSSEEFAHECRLPEYGVIARHGHEFDVLNYEGTGSYGKLDYLRTPIGDPITTEIVARIPYELDRWLQDHDFTPDDRGAIKRNYQDLDNVRPLTAILEWLLYRVRTEENAKVQEGIEETLGKVVDHFNSLTYVKLWIERHGKFGNPIDEADKIRTLLFLLKYIKLSSLDELLKMLEKIKAMDYFLKDDLLEAAPSDPSLLDPIRYVVYGHTHEPLEIPLRVIGPLNQVYLNTGTWRSRQFKSKADDSFIAWKNITYAVFYQAGERGVEFPAFETWTGALKTS